MFYEFYYILKKQNFIVCIQSCIRCIIQQNTHNIRAFNSFSELLPFYSILRRLVTEMFINGRACCIVVS